MIHSSIRLIRFSDSAYSYNIISNFSDKFQSVSYIQLYCIIWLQRTSFMYHFHDSFMILTAFLKNLKALLRKTHPRLMCCTWARHFETLWLIHCSLFTLYLCVSTGSCMEIKSQRSQRDCLMVWSPCSCCECCIYDSVTFSVKKTMISVCVNVQWGPSFTTSDFYFYTTTQRNEFIQQGCIKLIKRDSKIFKCYKLILFQINAILKYWKMYHDFHKNIKQQNW